MSGRGENAATREAARMGFEALKPALDAWSDDELHALLAATLGVTGARRRNEAHAEHQGKMLKVAGTLAHRPK